MSTCPCELARPCQETCACYAPFMSGGCLRCASYGSKEQQLAAAEAIADAFDKLEALQDPRRYLVLDLANALVVPVEGAQASPRRVPDSL